MEQVGLLGGLLVLLVALWGLLVGVEIVFRRATWWIRLLVMCLGGICVYRILDAPSVDLTARRGLVLLDFGILVAGTDAISRVSHWIDQHT